MILHVIKPVAEDYHKLTEICLKTYEHWGYPEYLVDLWKDKFTITPRYIRNHNILKIENEHGEILGFGSLEKDYINDIYEISHLWVLPEYMDKSIGKILLENLEKKVEHKKTIKVITDPHAMAFFQKHGYQKVGEVKSKPDGRKMPLLKKIMKINIEV